MELNPDHRIVRGLRKRVTADPSDPTIKDLVWLLFETSVLTGGFTLDQPTTFAGRIHRLVELGLGDDEDDDPLDPSDTTTTTTTTSSPKMTTTKGFLPRRYRRYHRQHHGRGRLDHRRYEKRLVEFINRFNNIFIIDCYDKYILSVKCRFRENRKFILHLLIS